MGDVVGKIVLMGLYGHRHLGFDVVDGVEIVKMSCRKRAQVRQSPLLGCDSILPLTEIIVFLHKAIVWFLWFLLDFFQLRFHRTKSFRRAHHAW